MSVDEVGRRGVRKQAVLLWLLETRVRALEEALATLLTGLGASVDRPSPEDDGRIHG